MCHLLTYTYECYVTHLMCEQKSKHRICVKRQSSDLGDKVHHLEMNIVLSNRHPGIRTIVHDTFYQLDFIVIIAICQIDIETS